ncbi:ubiquitin-related domain-containing protein [Rhizophagus irregularis DAOM 181602=DAOM 197198]|nr:ubiquitin-related domain-containing protein [Rhizophagus irregularis DAOM 181602=DAOM 197198]
MAFPNNNFDNSNSSLVAAALKSLTGLPIISQSQYLNQIQNGNNNAIYQNINPVSLHSSYLAGGEVQNNNDDPNPHYSLQGNENINQDYSDSQFVSDTSFSTQESSHFCSANNTQCFIVNPNNFMMSSLQQQITQLPQQISQQIFPFQQHIAQKFQVFQLAQSHIPQQIQSQLSQIQQIQSQHSQQSQISQQIQQNSNQISQKPTMIVIRICTLNGQIIPIKNVPIIAKISVIKFHIESKTRIPSNQQRLIYSGILLKDNLTLLDYNILNNNAMINLIGQNNEVINFIDSDFLDPMYDCDFTNIVDDKKFMRGSYEYHRPCGWKRIAVKVLNKYGDNAWLGKAAKKGSWRYESDPNEWPGKKI